MASKSAPARRAPIPTRANTTRPETRKAPLPPPRQAPPAPRQASSPAPAAPAAPVSPPAPVFPEAAAPAAAPAAAADAKKPRKRSAPMFRAVKFTRLADKNVRRAVRLIGNWHGTFMPEQQTVNDGIVAALRQAAPLLEKALLGVGLLDAAGLAPTEARGRAITEPFVAGEHVGIKAKYYNAELHGAANDYEVVVSVGNQVRIRPTGDVHATQLIVNRAHLDLLDEDLGEKDEGEEDEEDEAEEKDETTATEDPEAEPDPDGEGEGEGEEELNFDRRS